MDKNKIKIWYANYYQYSSNIFTNPDDSVGFGSCLYTKVEYKDGTIDYWPLILSKVIVITHLFHKEFVLELVKKTGDVCLIDTDCGEGGVL
jgi:hypothetical protein